MLTIESDLSNIPEQMDVFYSKCRDLGYVNNVSAKRMKLDWLPSVCGNMWALMKEDVVIGTGGCHAFEDGFRIQFRGCEIPGTDVKKSLARGHWNSSTFRELIPYQIKWAETFGSDVLYITTNIGTKNHRAMQLIAKQNMLTFVRNDSIFNTDQTVWKFNSKKYFNVRSKIQTYVV